MDIARLDMHLLNLIKHTTGMVAAEFNQNQLTQLKQLVKLNMMNVSFLMHVPNLNRYISEVKFQEVFLLLLRAPQAADQPELNIPHDPVAQIQEIYNRLEDARAQPEFDQNLIENLIRQFQQSHEVPDHDLPHGFTAPNRPNNDEQHIVNLEPLLTPAQYSNLILVNQVNENLNEMNRVLPSSNGPGSEQLTEITRDLISKVQDPSNWKQLVGSDAEIKIKPYIYGTESLNDICNQVTSMYMHSLTRTSGGEIDQGYTWCPSFHKDIFNGNHQAVDTFLQGNPSALTARITVDGNTALHVAVKAEKLTIVQTLLENLSQPERLKFLEKRNKEGKTILYIAASSGNPTIVEELVRTNRHILLDECEKGTNHMLPLFVAAKYDKQDMVKYIYDEMRPYRRENAHSPPENPNDKTAKVRTRQWALFLANLIYNDHYDMASRVIDDYPHLALYKYTDVETPLFVLAQRPSLGANVTFHDKASKASKLLEEIILTIKDWESHKPALSVAFFKAAEVGSIGFVDKFIKSHRATLNWLNDLHQNIFHVAIINRQENIFNLIYGLEGSEKNDQTGTADNKNNWMLHLAGNLAPAYRLNQVPGPAMQLQRELQWFQAVKEIVPNISIDAKNLDNMTPQELFAEKHKDLMKDGETWIRKTASSGSIVATLITTVVFAAGFTVPGGNSPESGDPLFLGHTLFLLFVIADLAALITSSISVLLFLSILTSRFTEEDFIKSLPIKLFWGLFLLFFSMSAMMFAFCDAIYIIIQKHYHWYCILFIPMAGFIPLLVFFLVMYPLPFDLLQATGNSIFHESSRQCIIG